MLTEGGRPRMGGQGGGKKPWARASGKKSSPASHRVSLDKREDWASGSLPKPLRPA